MSCKCIDPFIVTYEGMENYAYVLGRYEVTVDRNQIVGITWSHDGENTSGGFDAEAWGAEQIKQMLRLNQDIASYPAKLISRKTEALAQAGLLAVLTGPDELPVQPDYIAWEFVRVLF